MAWRGEEAYRWADDALRKFHAESGIELFRASKSLGGMKLVLGGSSRFLGTHLDSVRKMTLYSDTILIPDPVLPWLESPRSEERFRLVNFLQAVFVLLHLKPLVDADLPYPAISVFPSWEKSFEEKDPQTIEAIPQLVTDIVAFHGQLELHTFDDLKRFAVEHEEEFFKIVEGHALLVSPGGKIGDSLANAIDGYRADIKTWRTDDHVKQLDSLPLPLLVLNAIWERIAPQYHLLENAEELQSHPMVCLPVHWHYYRLCAALFEGRLKALSLLTQDTATTLRSLNQPDLGWLGNVPVEALVELRKNNENEDFRRHVSDYVRQLQESSLGDLDRVTAEVTRGIGSLIAKHQAEIEKIVKKYKRLHGQTSVAAWTTFAATLYPSLAPFVGKLAPFAAIAKYVWDKTAERRERKELSHSLMGVLATAKIEVAGKRTATKRSGRKRIVR
jgi:hypothetical protein